MDTKKVMLAISANLQPSAATVVSRTTVTKENGSDRMWSRLNGERKHSFPENPWWGKVTIETEYIGLFLGGDYKSFTAGAAVRSGAAQKKSEVEVKTDKSWHTQENRFFETDKATRSKYYLKIQTSESTLKSGYDFVGMRETYIINDVRYDRKGAEKILEGYLKPIQQKAPTSTQIAAGVTQQNTVHYYMPRLEDIILIKQGDYTYTR